MASIVVSGDVSGTVTLSAPSVAGTTTLTLPTTSGTVLTTASGQTLTSPVLTNPSISSGSLTFADATTQSSGKGVAKAWVNFAGSSGSINKSFNVSSVTRVSTGIYTITFTTAMPDATYAVVTTGYSDASTYGFSIGASSLTTSSVSIQCRAGASAYAFYDSPAIHVAIFD